MDSEDTVRGEATARLVFEMIACLMVSLLDRS